VRRPVGGGVPKLPQELVFSRYGGAIRNHRAPGWLGRYTSGPPKTGPADFQVSHGATVKFQKFQSHGVD